MYHIFDHQQGAYIKVLETREDVVQWFAVNDPKYRNLNVTGNDCFSYFVDAGRDYNAICIRRFQVFDSEGRSVDPRIWDVKPLPEARKRQRRVWGNGAKRHCHRRKRPSLRLRSIRCFTEITENVDFNIIKDCSRIRKTAVISSDDAWTISEKKTCQRTHGKTCWKAQTKNPHQWGRHKPRYNKEISIIVDVDI